MIADENIYNLIIQSKTSSDAQAVLQDLEEETGVRYFKIKVTKKNFLRSGSNYYSTSLSGAGNQSKSNTYECEELSQSCSLSGLYPDSNRSYFGRSIIYND